MMRKVLKALGVATLVVLTAGSVADAAPKKVARHRARHSSRVTVGSTTVKKQVTRKTKRRIGRKKTTVSATTVKRKTTTKPR